MNQIAAAPVRQITAETMEQVLAAGDLRNLTTQQRLEYLNAVCKSVGLNPLTRPIRFMSLSGTITPYATRDCADQLRKINGVSIEVVDRRIEDDLYIVTVRAMQKHGRQDEDMGAVTMGQLKGEARANAILKAITKAKRRVTLSICGLGFLDETEVETIPGAVVVDERPAPRQEGRKPPIIDDSIPVLDKGADPDMELSADGPEYPFATAKGGKIYGTGSEWIAAWKRLKDACERTGALDKLRAALEMNKGAIDAVAAFDPQAAADVRKMLDEALNGPDTPPWERADDGGPDVPAAA